ncbi:hypothetical protein LJC60_01715 [Ruminococcaceae bacterium OttesenSCG-928-D13]|nr:hypothetical protein [Ruminococcaceae bacterium OttesenSCG-928-D13]
MRRGNPFLSGTAARLFTGTEMYAEFVFPYYERIAQVYGRLSYGCCEPVDPVWDMVSRLPNLRKISISPWCNEEKMGEALRGSSIIYHRKPSPTSLGWQAIWMRKP